MRRGRLVVVVLVAVVALAGCDWTQVGFGPGKTNVNPYEPALTSSSVAHLTTVWSQSCSCLTSLVVGGVVYTANSLGSVNPRPVKLEALDEKTGSPRWTVSFPSVNFAQFVAIGNGLAYVDVSPVSGSDQIVAYDAQTGAVRWTITPPAPSTGSVTLVDGGTVLDGDRLFVAAFAADGVAEVSAIDATGHVAWAATPGGEVRALAADPGKTLYVTSSLVLTAPPGRLPLLTGLAESDGTRRSEVVPKTNQGLAFNGPYSFAFANGLIYEGPFAIHPDTGALAWSAPGNDEAAVASTAVLMTSSSGIVARDPLNGTVLWSASARPIGPQNPVVAGNLVFVAFGSNVQIRDLANGNLLGTSPSLMGFDYYISPSGGSVVVQDGNGLHAFVPT